MNNNDITIEKKIYATPSIDSEGNYNLEKMNIVSRTYHLVDNEGHHVSNEHSYIKKLFGDFYIVYDMFLQKSSDEINKNNFSLKAGVLKVNRDKSSGLAISTFLKEETIVVPQIYDKLCKGGEDTIIGMVDNKYTFIEMNPNSAFFAQQLTPVSLNSVGCFGEKYKGYAECCFDEKTGYLPRIEIPFEQMELYKLLSEKQVKFLIENNIKLTHNVDKLTETQKQAVLSRVKRGNNE